MKKFLALLCAVVLLMPCVPCVRAADDPFAGFTKRAEYRPDMYTDTDDAAWYGASQLDVIRRVTELGLMNGMGDGTFQPDAALRICEAVKIACVLNDIYCGGDGRFPTSEPWYGVYMEEAEARGIIRKNEFPSPEKPATQLQAAVIFSRCLPPEGLETINLIGSIAGVETNSMLAIQNADSVFTLYGAGVMNGNDAARQFYHYTEVSRAEAALLALRMAVPQLRQRFDILSTRGDAQRHTDYAATAENGAVITLGLQPRSVLTDVFGDMTPQAAEYGWPGRREIPCRLVRAHYGNVEIAYAAPEDGRDVIYVYMISITGECGLTVNGLSVGDDESRITEVHGEDEYSLRTYIGDTSYWGNPNDHSYIFDFGPPPSYCKQSYKALDGRITEIGMSCSI